MSLTRTPLADGEALNLTNCDREPIHVPGGVQPFGALIAMSADWVVSAASVNVGEVLGIDHGALIGTRLNDHVTDEAVNAIRLRLTKLGFPDAVERIFRLCVRRDAGGFHDVAVHVSGDRFVLEFERSADEEAGQHEVSLVRPLVDRVNQTTSVQAMCDMAAKQVRALTGYDRVMVYRFGEDGSGEVVAEARAPQLEAFLDLR